MILEMLDTFEKMMREMMAGRNPNRFVFFGANPPKYRPIFRHAQTSNGRFCVHIMCIYIYCIYSYIYIYIYIP